MSGQYVYQPQPEVSREGDFDREAIELAAARTAQDLIQRSVHSDSPEERIAEMEHLRQELAADSGNQYIVEAIALQISREKLVLGLDEFDALFPRTPAAAD